MFNDLVDGLFWLIFLGDPKFGSGREMAKMDEMDFMDLVWEKIGFLNFMDLILWIWWILFDFEFLRFSVASFFVIYGVTPCRQAQIQKAEADKVRVIIRAWEWSKVVRF